jgi:hypothetical protein
MLGQKCTNSINEQNSTIYLPCMPEATHTLLFVARNRIHVTTVHRSRAAPPQSYVLISSTFFNADKYRGTVFPEVSQNIVAPNR